MHTSPKSYTRTWPPSSPEGRAAALGLLALSYVKLVSGSFNPFIYFQF